MTTSIPAASTASWSARDVQMEFFGNIPYCYANSAAMVLSMQGEQVAPGLVEVLTGVGLGAVRIERGPTFFSTTPAKVPEGLDKALELLGFSFTSVAGPADAQAQDLLRADLATGPVILGPLDMGYLTYIPWHGPAAGSDHYVVAYAMDGERAFFQDPAGFPCTSLGFDDLTRAWRAERIGYHSGPFQRWLNLRRVSRPTAEEVHDRAMAYFRTLYRDQSGLGRLTGSEAIRTLAAEVGTGGLSDDLRGFYTNFALPLGARRALDFARFFARGGDADIATLKQEQARLFGEGLVATTQGDWARLAGVFAGLADREAGLERAFGR
jgi:hypothetical protein